MKNNDWLMIVLAFIAGYCLRTMMKNMPGSRLVEGATALSEVKQFVRTAPARSLQFAEAPRGGVMKGGLCTYKGNECAWSQGDCSTVACSADATNETCVRACGGVRGYFPNSTTHPGTWGLNKEVLTKISKLNNPS